MIPLEAFFLLRMRLVAYIARGNLRLFTERLFSGRRCQVSEYAAILIAYLFRGRSASHFCHFRFLATTSFFHGITKGTVCTKDLRKRRKRM